MKKDYLPIVAYDVDDTMLAFNSVFIPWVEKSRGVDLSHPATNAFDYNVRYPDLDIDWVSLIDNFTLEKSVEYLRLESGLVNHLQHYSNITTPFVETWEQSLFSMMPYTMFVILWDQMSPLNHFCLEVIIQTGILKPQNFQKV